MSSLPERILEYAEAKPEATPIQAGNLLHIGDRAPVARSLSRLARSERLLRVCRGVYMRPIQTRFGLRAPSLEKAIVALSALWGETIVSNGGDAANWLGLTTQNTVRTVYLTSGPDRLLHFEAHQVELLHASRWQLTAAHGTAGIVIRAISWLRPNEVERSLGTGLPRLSRKDLDELVGVQAVLPKWMAEPLSRRIARA